MRAVLIIVAAVLFAPAPALADFSGRVVKIADGDTLTVLVNCTHLRLAPSDVKQ